MPRSVSDEELELRKRARRRLVGAIVLVTIAVMILPMVLDQEPQPVTQDIAITIPPKRDARSFAPKAVAPPAVRPPVAPKPAEPAAEPMAAAETEKAKGEPPGLEKPAEPAPAPRTAAPQAGAKPVEAPAAARTEAKPEPKTEAKPDAAARTEAFVVQLDAFSNPENARQQQKKLSSAGISSYTDTVKTAKGELTRVRVGPYSTRQQAEQMRERIRRIGMNAVVVAK